MTRVIKPRVIVVSGEKRRYEVIPTPWYDRVLFTFLDTPLSVVDLFKAVVEGVALVFIASVTVLFLITAFIASH